ncbi:MAG: hypothetical protein DI564_06140 [Rhodanobacter denitrificans]|uniref:Protein kinase domain-containing protein n=1 Tax=Rhodanobacter denitrificans TaxID=666685 RepID=A0A2W5KNF2_9GAMM|nr:MAG: hypothetical protein DI564_06140 [Rhodanobacter denitrificans]
MEERQRRALRLMRDSLDREPTDRAAYLAEQCADDATLRAQVERLLGRADVLSGAGDEETAPEAAADALVGTRLGPFRVGHRIGRGGMGVVYLGRREGADFDQVVAIKLIRRGLDYDEVQARFLRERRILARLSHPNLARFIDGGVAPDGRPWFALEYVEGEPITRWCDARRLDVAARVRLFLDACAAVQYAHGQLVVHRDLKPGNILACADGTLRLLDFGIARLLADDDDGEVTLTRHGRYALTPGYAAPEQFSGEATGVAADVYALGAVLYELIAGVPPIALHGCDLAEAGRRVREQLPAPPLAALGRAGRDAAERDLAPTQIVQRRLAQRATSLRGFRAAVSADLARILEQALAKEPARRYASATALAEDLQRWLAGAPVRAAGNRFGYRLGKFVRRNRGAVAVAALLAAALLGASAYALHRAQREQIQREAAQAELERSDAVREYVMLMFRTAAEQQGTVPLSARDVLKQGTDQLVTRFAGAPETGQTTALMLAELFMMLGDSEGARPLLESVLVWDGIERRPDLLASARYNLGQVVYFGGDTARARSLLDAAQRYWREMPARHARQLNESRTLQAQIEAAEGRIDASIATLDAAIEERPRLIGQRDRELGVALAIRADRLSQVGRYEDAFASADAACTLFESLGLARSPVGLGAVNNRAMAALRLGRLAEASADFRHVVDVHRQLYGVSPQLAVAQNNLALTLLRQERAAEAVPLLEESLRIAVEQGGRQARATAMPRVNLAEAYVALDRVEEAAALAEEAVAVNGEVFGADALQTGLAHRARARVRQARGDAAGAGTDLARAEAIFGAMGAGGAPYLESLQKLRQGRAEAPH